MFNIDNKDHIKQIKIAVATAFLTTIAAKVGEFLFEEAKAIIKPKKEKNNG